MTAPGYELREDLTAAHRTALSGWAGPGAWWSGRERLAIVTECRRARAAEDRPAWEAPSTVEGLVPDDHPLPAVAVDVIWRLTRHPGTLTRDWYDGVIDRGIEPLRYLELVAVVATAASVDMFARALALDPPALPDPRSGSPSAEAPAGVEVGTHWVPTVPMTGPNVLLAMSAVPNEHPIVRTLAEAQYLPPDALMNDLAWSRGTLDRMQTELIAARTSALNECFY